MVNISLSGYIFSSLQLVKIWPLLVKYLPYHTPTRVISTIQISMLCGWQVY